MDKISWSALEYEAREKSPDWFWALGIIVIAGAASAAIYSNYFFAILIILSGVLIGFLAKKDPEIIFYELDSNGLHAGPRFYPYANIQAFWVVQEEKPKLFVRLTRPVLPNISINIESASGSEIKKMLLNAGVAEEEMQEHHAEKIMEFFGF